ncbi:MAG: hypothetical protein L0J73_04025 [Halomonas sp.]|nr:hypothetical protein [Halomonas sp.]
MEASDEVVRDVKAACYYRLDTSKRGGHVKKQWLECNKVLNIIYRMEMAEQRLAELERTDG